MYFIIVRDSKTGRFITDRVNTIDEARVMKTRLHEIGESDVYIAEQVDIKEAKHYANKEA